MAIPSNHPNRRLHRRRSRALAIAEGRRRRRGPGPVTLALAAVAVWASALLADDPLADCEARVAQRPESWESSCLYRLARRPQLREEALRRLEELTAANPSNPFLLTQRALVEMLYGSQREAASILGDAADLFAARGDLAGEGFARLNLSESLRRQGLLGRSERELERAEFAARSAGDARLAAQTGIAHARLLRKRGELERSFYLLRRLEEELGPESEYGVLKDLLWDKAGVLKSLGRLDEALSVYESWAGRARREGRFRDEATALVSRAVALVEMPPRPGLRQEAERSARGALAVAERSGQPSAEAKARELLGQLVPGEEGQGHLARCVKLAEQMEKPSQESLCLFALASSQATDHPERARSTLSRALTLALASEDPWVAAYGWAERFRVDWATLPRNKALTDSLPALDLIEALRRLQISEIGRAGFFAAWTGAYHTLAGRLLASPGGPSREELETAFTVAERLRARVLLDSLAAARAEPSPPPEPALAEQRTAVLREIVGAQRQLQHPALSTDERAAVLDELDRLELDLADVETRLSTAASPTALPETGFVTLAETEAALAPSEALFAFLVAPNEDVFGKFAGGSWLLAVTRGGSRAYRLPGQLELETKVKTFRGLIRVRDDGDLAMGSVTLYDDLLSEALADLPPEVTALTLVPDGVLHLLPFGLLRPHPQNDPLAERFLLSEAPSATLWRRWRQQPAPAPAAALILADPAFAAQARSLGEGRGGPFAAEDRQWAFETGTRLGRLPHAEEEGRALLRRLGGPPSRLWVGEEATEVSLKSAPLDEFGVLHLAAHALVDEQRPHRSAVLLAAGGPGEDGLLQPREIAGLKLSGKLVVLSACESGSGQVLSGEGVQSLARAFFRAGARAVAASLWRLRDAEAAAFFDSFYRALAEGGSVAGALAAARRERRAAGAPAAAWAGVVVLGDGGLVPVPGGVPQPWPTRLPWLAAGALVIVLLGLGAMRWRRRR